MSAPIMMSVPMKKKSSVSPFHGAGGRRPDPEYKYRETRTGYEDYYGGTAIEVNVLYADDAVAITPYDCRPDYTNDSSSYYGRIGGYDGPYDRGESDEYPRIQCAIDVALDLGLPLDLCGRTWYVRVDAYHMSVTGLIAQGDLHIRNGTLLIGRREPDDNNPTIGLHITGTSADDTVSPIVSNVNIYASGSYSYLTGLHISYGRNSCLSNVNVRGFNPSGAGTKLGYYACYGIYLSSCSSTRWFGGSCGERASGVSNLQHLIVESCTDTLIIGVWFQDAEDEAGVSCTSSNSTLFVECSFDQADDAQLVLLTDGQDVCFVGCRFEVSQSGYLPITALDIQGTANVRAIGCTFTQTTGMANVINNEGTTSSAGSQVVGGQLIGPALALVANSFPATSSSYQLTNSSTTEGVERRFAGVGVALEVPVPAAVGALMNNNLEFVFYSAATETSVMGYNSVGSS